MRAELKLIPPKSGRTPNWYIRGTYLGTYVEQSVGTADKAVARKALAKIRRDIERGAYAQPSGPTWVSATNAYLDHRPEIADVDRSFIARLSTHFGDAPLATIDQAAIDAAALRLYPSGQPATRNRAVYTPVSAILRHAKVALPISRPKGAQGKPRKHWLRQEQINAYLDAAWERHPRFAALCTMLFFCGCRLSEALKLDVEDLSFGLWTEIDGERLECGFADVAMTKNGEPQRMHLPPVVVQAIRLALAEPANATWIPKDPKKPRPQPRSTGSVFCLTKSGALYKLFREVEVLAGVSLPKGVAFHLARHTYGASVRSHGGQLEDTGRWTSRGGAKPYNHYDVTEAQKVADRFPGAAGGKPKTLKGVG